MNIDLTEALLDKQKSRPFVLGRYSVSRLWGILNGYCTPEEFIRGEHIDFRSAMRMRMGTLKHELVQELMPEWKLEVKKEYKYKGIIIVGKCDALKDDTILEIKTSEKVIDVAKRWQIWQVKMYLSMFKVSKGIIVQPTTTSSRLLLKDIGTIERNDAWFKKELVKIEDLHKTLKELYAKIKEEESKEKV